MSGNLRNAGASFANGLTFEKLLASRSTVFFSNWYQDREHFPISYGVGIKIPVAEDGNYSFIVYLGMSSASDDAEIGLYYGRFKYTNSQIVQSKWIKSGE